MIKCHKCEQEMLWLNDYDYEEVYGGDKEGIISIYMCRDCDIHYEITEFFNEGEDE